MKNSYNSCSPGEKSAMRNSPSRGGSADANADTTKMTGKKSQPMPEKGSMSTKVVTVKGGSGAQGVVGSRGDAHAYLGHFRSPEVVKRGHNFGFPGLGGVFGGGSDKPKPMPGVNAPPTKKQLSNPKFRETHQAASAKSDLQQAKKSGGDVAGAQAKFNEVKADKKQTFGDIKSARQAVRAAKKAPMQSDALSGANPLSAARANLKAAKQTAKSKYAGAYKARQMNAGKKSGGGGLGKLIGKMNPF